MAHVINVFSLIDISISLVLFGIGASLFYQGRLSGVKGIKWLGIAWLCLGFCYLTICVPLMEYLLWESTSDVVLPIIFHQLIVGIELAVIGIGAGILYQGKLSKVKGMKRFGIALLCLSVGCTVCLLLALHGYIWRTMAHVINVFSLMYINISLVLFGIGASLFYQGRLSGIKGIKWLGIAWLCLGFCYLAICLLLLEYLWGLLEAPMHVQITFYQLIIGIGLAVIGIGAGILYQGKLSKVKRMKRFGIALLCLSVGCTVCWLLALHGYIR